jgi:hypothetical protein
VAMSATLVELASLAREELGVGYGWKVATRAKGSSATKEQLAWSQVGH